ncbi:MAG: J domain-containing protein [Terracidiphilus sp.]
MDLPNYYEFLQISPNAEAETIHRVYKFLAARLHPDNPETGDADKFFLLKQAYDVLSHPGRRAKYDAGIDKEAPPPDPLSNSIDFMDQLDGELNRRLAVLALLYVQRRTNPNHPEVSLAEIELRMGFPRDYLEFTMWYLQKKTYIVGADNARYTLTAEGVDFVELQRANVPVLHNLLTSGTQPATVHPGSASDPIEPPRKPIIVPHPTTHQVERRVNSKDRRASASDHQTK